MKTLPLLLAAFLVIFTGSARAEVIPRCTQKTDGNNNIAVFCEAEGEHAPWAFLLDGTVDDETDSLSWARFSTLTILGSGTPQQFDIDSTVGLSLAENALSLDDYNFDGHADLKLLLSTGAGPNAEYGYWLYEPTAGIYTATNLGAKLSGFDITPDPETQTITTSARASCCSWEMETYHWVDGDLRKKTHINMGSGFSIRIPLASGEDGAFSCGTQTYHYDDDVMLISTDVAQEPGDCEEADNEIVDRDLSDLIERLATYPEGYELHLTDQQHFSVVYDPPLPDPHALVAEVPL